jgi:co-chaperonin GroES (HSP10)
MFKPIKITDLRALKDHVLVADMNFEARTTSSGIQLLSDDGRSAGIRPRWAQVYAIGPTQKEITKGQWILVTHGRWTRGVTIEDETGEHTLRRIDPNDVLLVSDEVPHDDTLSNAVQIDSKTRW